MIIDTKILFLLILQKMNKKTHHLKERKLYHKSKKIKIKKLTYKLSLENKSFNTNSLNQIQWPVEIAEGITILVILLSTSRGNLSMLMNNLIEVAIKEPSSMARGMDLEHFTTVKAENTSEIGNKIEWVEKEYYIIRITKWLMMENGKKINYQVMEFCTMNKYLNWKKHLIIEIFLMFKNFG